jgi:hypothetical protein
MALWLIEQGANDFNQAFIGACRNGHQKMAKWLIEQGATNILDGLETAIRLNHQELADNLWILYNLSQ